MKVGKTLISYLPLKKEKKLSSNCKNFCFKKYLNKCNSDDKLYLGVRHCNSLNVTIASPVAWIILAFDKTLSTNA